MQHPSQNRVKPLLRYCLIAHRHILMAHETCVIGMIIYMSKHIGRKNRPASMTVTEKRATVWGSPTAHPSLLSFRFVSPAISACASASLSSVLPKGAGDPQQQVFERRTLVQLPERLHSALGFSDGNRTRASAG